jgi:SrtB family sortase
MDRGKSYRQTPMVKKRFNWRLLIIIVLFVLLVVSVAEIIAYFVHSHNNRVEQAALAAQHDAAILEEEQNPVVTGAIVETATPVPAATNTAPEATAAREVAATATTATATPEVAKAFFQVVGLTRQSMISFIKQNSDTVGWITIEGLVDQPIVYRNNSYYLTHDFKGYHNNCGAIFLDVNHPIGKDAQNLLVYGHNMKDGSMFGRLVKYMNDNFLHSHYSVQLETRFESFNYIIFAVDRVSTNYSDRHFLNFSGHPSFNNAEDFDNYIDEVYNQSYYTRFLDVNYTDTLLTLATCIDDDRLVLVARRQRESETEEDIQRYLLGLYMR